MSGSYDGPTAAQAPGSFQADGLGRATSIAVWVSAIGSALLAVSDWRSYAIFKDDPQSWDAPAFSVLQVVAIIASVPAAVMFVVWLRRVRSNAERFCKAPHRHSRGWVLGGWLVPVINLWYPKQIVDDIVAASNPRTSPLADELPRLRASVVQTWWITWIASTLISFADPTVPADNPSAGDLQWAAISSTASTVLTLVCAVYAVRVIQLINNLQASRPWVAWWETSTTSTS
jgi:hypothetical protein